MIFHMDIAGIKIALHSSIPFKVDKKLSCFSTNTSKLDNMNQEDIYLHIIKKASIQVPENALILDEKMYWSKNSDEKKDISIFLYDPDDNKFTYQLKVNTGWDNAVITCNEERADILLPFQGSLGEILFRNHLLYHQGLVIHAAAIEWKGKGIMFSAPSGTGKTTQANLWKKYRKAKILNADRPAVRVINNIPYVYGTLWNGSSKKFRNHSVPLSCLVILEQSPQNSIRELEKREAITRLMPRCFLPYFHEEVMNLAIDNLEKIIAVTPVYLLQCRPDSEAVELVYQCLK